MLLTFLTGFSSLLAAGIGSEATVEPSAEVPVEVERLAAPPSEELLRRPSPPEARQPLGALITDEDYPRHAIRAGSEGVTAVILTVGTSGRVTGCYVESGAGDELLDDATCRILGERARFSPARDSKGKTVPSAARARIRWQLAPWPELPLSDWRMELVTRFNQAGELVSCQSTSVGIDAGRSLRCDGSPAGLQAQPGTDTHAKTRTFRFKHSLFSGARTATELPVVTGVLLARDAARMKIGSEGELLECEFIQRRGPLMLRKADTCADAFPGPFEAPTSPVEVTMVSTLSMDE